MTYSLLFDDALKNETSDLYKEWATNSTIVLERILSNTTAVMINETDIVWYFTNGSVIARTFGIPLTNVASVADVNEQLADFDYSTIPNLQPLTITGNRD